MARIERRSRGDGSLYKRSDGMWVGVVDLGIGGDGKRRRKTVSSKKYDVAVKKLRDLKKQVVDNGGDVPTASITVQSWLERWLRDIAAPRIRPTTLAGYRNDVEQHIIPEVGRYRLDQLKPQHVRAMGQAIVAKGKSSTTALRCHRELSKALTDAVREGLIIRNPASLVDAPRKAAATRGALTVDQARALINATAADPLGALWYFALVTGARRGEILGLELDRAPSAAGTIDLAWQLQDIDPADVPAGYEIRYLHRRLALTRPKSSAGIRTLPWVAITAAPIERAEAALADRPNPHNLVWRDDKGRPLHPDAVSKAWKTALDAVEIRPHVPLHAARHTTATLLHDLGVDGHTVAAMLGHSNVTVTRGYQHVDLRLVADALDKLQGALAIEG